MTPPAVAPATVSLAEQTRARLMATYGTTDPALLREKCADIRDVWAAELVHGKAAA